MVVENQYGCIMADGMGLGTPERLCLRFVLIVRCRKDAANDLSNMDSAQAVATRQQADDREVHYCVSKQPCAQLGE